MLCRIARSGRTSYDHAGIEEHVFLRNAGRTAKLLVMVLLGLGLDLINCKMASLLQSIWRWSTFLVFEGEACRTCLAWGSGSRLSAVSRGLLCCLVEGQKHCRYQNAPRHFIRHVYTLQPGDFWRRTLHARTQDVATRQVWNESGRTRDHDPRAQSGGEPLQRVVRIAMSCKVDACARSHRPFCCFVRTEDVVQGEFSARACSRQVAAWSRPSDRL